MFVKTKNDGILNVNKFAGIDIFELSESICSDDDIPFAPPDEKYELVLLEYNRVQIAKGYYRRQLEKAYTILETNTKKEAEEALQSICNSLHAGDKYWSPNDSPSFN